MTYEEFCMINGYSLLLAGKRLARYGRRSGKLAVGQPANRRGKKKKQSRLEVTHETHVLGSDTNLFAQVVCVLSHTECSKRTVPLENVTVVEWPTKVERMLYRQMRTSVEQIPCGADRGTS